ncbi:hypothetical protein AAA799E16_01303 [Marine Group I thaumarchaeote SCGC AAA799-E16]|uniref:Uncharacterized protein n=1 Tax=Marine Group I thaumarchaeote SCGC AAA799-E16 TaxID=1502292 RepID=A0A081S4Z9_9ARCH|nr:hypothetical protein AAA799E16_01303 [Marine Group I thaumarchaeote SCGC AAA799-E16]
MNKQEISGRVQSTTDYKKLCSLILGVEPQIRSVYIYHTNGELLVGGMREGVDMLLPIEEMTKSIHNTILRWKTRELIFPFLGAGKYSFTEYEKIKRITFPLDKQFIVIIGIEIEAKHDIIIEKIFQIIQNRIT